jgi:hypothetical protein
LRFILIILLLGLCRVTFGQVQVASDTSVVGSDTTVMRRLDTNAPIREFESVAKEHSPTRAALFSAAIPGLGQAYNKKYWKIPIVWGGFVAFGYFINWHNDQYQFYRKNLIYAIAQDPDYPNETNLDPATLRSARDYYRRNRDQLAIYGILFYMLQIVDAHVDAHLIEFDVNQDLSLRIQPDVVPVQYSNANVGLSLKLTF